MALLQNFSFDRNPRQQAKNLYLLYCRSGAVWQQKRSTLDKEKVYIQDWSAIKDENQTLTLHWLFLQEPIHFLNEIQAWSAKI